MILRERDGKPEVLLLQRNSKIAFHGGAWVFPGGKLDAADRGGESDPIQVARRTGAREVHEEAGISLNVGDLTPFAHWTTPDSQPRRFAAWFFAVPVGSDCAVTIDHSEIVDYQWLSFDDALANRAAGAIALPAPTFVTLTSLRHFQRVDDIMRAMAASEAQHFRPRVAQLPDGRCSVYAEDTAYHSLDLDAAGPRHRLMMTKSSWDYIRSSD